jgi:TRAP-type C4-dicarboxylate transport system permease small subunit
MRKYINAVVDYLLFVVLAVMAATMAVNVLCRFLLSFSIYWADELTQSLMLWLTFLGAAAAIREHTHYSFNYLEEHLSGKLRKGVGLLSRLTTLSAVVLLLYWSVEVTAGIAVWIMPALEISRAWIYGACPVGCLFMLYYCLTDLFTFLKQGV